MEAHSKALDLFTKDMDLSHFVQHCSSNSYPCAFKFVVLMLMKELASTDTNSYLVDVMIGDCPTEL